MQRDGRSPKHFGQANQYYRERNIFSEVCMRANKPRQMFVILAKV